MDYLFKHLTIKNGQIEIHNQIDTQALLMQHCQSISSGKYVRRSENSIVTSFDDSHLYLNKVLVFNHEADFAEYSYDIKLF